MEKYLIKYPKSKNFGGKMIFFVKNKVNQTIPMVRLIANMDFVRKENKIWVVQLPINLFI